MKQILRLGTRGSPLALVQAQIARDMIIKTHPEAESGYDIEIVPIRTQGDWKPSQQEKTFLEMGGSKGLFTKEIEEALLSGMIDVAVHSMKDVSVWDSPNLSFVAMLERGDPHDAFLSPMAPNLNDLPKGARVGTSSLRRKAQILQQRPDLKVVPLRGNVDTRMKKLAAEDVDATVLAMAGLIRLGVEDRIASILPFDIMLPAPAQGILGLQIRSDDDVHHDFLAPINHQATMLCARAERSMLRALNGSCEVPIAGYASIDGNGVCSLDALAASEDGKTIVRKSMTADAKDSEMLGKKVGDAIKSELPKDFFLRAS